MKHKILTIFLASFLLISCGNEDEKEKEMPIYDEESIQIHYHRDDGDYDDFALWLWKYPDGEGKEYLFNGKDDYGAIASYPLSLWSEVKVGGLGFIVKSKGTWNVKDPDGDRIMNFDKLEKDSSDVYHIFLQSGDKNIYTTKELETIDEITTAQFTALNKIKVVATANIVSYKIYEGETIITENTLTTPKVNFTYTFEEGKTASFTKSYKVSVVFDNSKEAESPISISSLYKTDEFSNLYNYDGELGAIYSKESTTFKVWSPVSTKIIVRIYDVGTPPEVDKTKGSYNCEEYTLTKNDNGVFEKTVTGDLEGKYYTYIVYNGNYKNKEIVDPYAYSTGINGLRGMIVDFSKTNPEGFDEMSINNIDRKHLTVYETHVADITSSNTWTNDNNLKKYAKTFKGASITGTTYTSGKTTVKTGFDHIKELGVNAVQLIPIFDQANDETNMSFNWGYNPSNYNSLEGGYSLDPYDGYSRIREFKELVKAYNEAGINIIMDVVYNHVNGAAGSNFDVLMPGYYYRYNTDGTLSNGSGCGNETASDMYMFKKFMIDSTCFYAREYKLGGFRFDLMGLHDLTTMKELSSALKQINPNIVVYGEPWTGGTTTLQDTQSAKQANMKSYSGYGAFNDKFRDALIKGGLNSASATGWITNSKSSTSSSDLEQIKLGVKGSIKLDSGEVNDPNKIVNYVTCHDNYTLYDRIKAAGIKDEKIIKKMAMLANSVVLTSNATTFMLAGEEFLRTKNGNSNSYNASYEVNELNYAFKVKNLDMFNNYQKLIKLKKEATGLALNAGENNTITCDTSKGNLITYSIRDNSTNRTYKIIHTNGYNESTLGTVDLSGYTLYLDTIDSNKILTSSTKLNSYETLIAYK